ncbi:AraC family transcriptional regulator [Pedobacter panaciterrae]|jgi:Transcriptional regulator containing an amidase domain and an AraC-type DNA-binding HTH domain|uniref:AraC family transcriptional regulator n=1 Tax=Pedobacter panaciterrae TaxID=363849 RepID=UPI00259645C4|nr:AraC family transcriptional regulator [uncultured Pedobacter sp.]
MNILKTSEYLSAIDLNPDSIFVLHEKIERKLTAHSHTKGQLTYVQGGVAFIHIKNVSYIIPARHYVWVPVGLTHYLEVRHQATVIRNIYFYDQGDTSEPFFQQLGIYPVNNLLLEMIIFTEKWNGNISADNVVPFQFLSSLKNLLPQLGIKAFPIALPTTNNERLLPIIAFLARHYNEQLTLEDMAKRFGMAERTLSRLFQSVMSISFLQYLKLLRMVRAIEMILQTSKSTSEIAYATGYNSLAAFSKAFFQLTNIRPSDFGKR